MRGIVHYDTPPKLLLRDWLLLQNHRAKIVKILFLPAEYIIQLENCIFCYIIFDNNCIKNTPTHHEPEYSTYEFQVLL